MITMQVHINVQSENYLSVKAKKFAAHNGGDNELDGIFSILRAVKNYVRTLSSKIYAPVGCR